MRLLVVASAIVMLALPRTLAAAPHVAPPEGRRLAGYHGGVFFLRVAANYWMTRHVRFSADYLLYTFSGAARGAGDGTHPLHELSFRVGAQL